MTPDLSPGLYIVATPIGNLGDLSPRAAHILTHAAVIAVEDSRVTAKLLHHIGVKRQMVPYHDHNAEEVRPGLIARMGREAVALVSDAGTPLISDPGYKLVRDARTAGHTVWTIPGPCAAVAALTLAGLPTDRFLFLGFLPSKAQARAAFGSLGFPWGFGSWALVISALLADIKNKHRILIAQVQFSIQHHRMRPGFGSGAVGLVEAADFFVGFGAELHKGHRATFGAEDDFVVGHHDRAFAGATFVPHHLAIGEAEAGH